MLFGFEQIDQYALKEINNIFEEGVKIVVIYPATRLIVIEKGNSPPRGFIISVKNVEETEGKFTYTISVNDSYYIGEKCGIEPEEANSWIVSGGSGSVTILPGQIMDAELILFSIPKDSPLCRIRYGVDIKKDGTQYNPTVNVDLAIMPP